MNKLIHYFLSSQFYKQEPVEKNIYTMSRVYLTVFQNIFQ